jgi:peptide/nickel transport system substrate-binding protein
VTASILSDPPFLFPGLNPANAAGTDALEDLVHAGLSVVDNRGALQPRLAEDVPSVENGLWRVLPDGRMETTWRIKPNVRWQDGTPFTAEDLVFTGRVLADRELPVFRNPAYDHVENIEAVDASTVRVTWVRPFIEADSMFSRTFAWPVPKHILEQPYLESKSTLAEHPYWNREYVGAGPFKLREWIKGSHLLLDANDGYVLGRPKIDVLEVRFFLEPTPVMANVMANVVEVTLGRGLSTDQALTLREQWREGRVEISSANEIHLWPQFLNPSPAVIGNVQFRRALLHAIDRQQLADTLEAGLSTVAHAWVRPGDQEYPELQGSIVRYDYDPRRAAQLIEGVGYQRGGDGIFRDAAGQRLSVEIRTTETNDKPKIMFPVADAWQQVGVAAEPTIVPRQRAADREYRATYPAFELVRGGSDLRSFDNLRSTEVRLPENNYTGSNYPRYANAEFDSLIDRYLTTIARTDRMQVAGQILHHMTDQVIALGLYFDTEPTAIANRLVNVNARNQQSTQAWNAHEWDVK